MKKSNEIKTTLVNFKCSAAEIKSLRTLAKKYTKGNISALIRGACTALACSKAAKRAYVAVQTPKR